MRALRVLLCCALLPLLAGCLLSPVRSVYPLYTSKDLAFGPALIGEWHDTDPDSPGQWTFARKGDGYQVAVRYPEEAQAMYQAHLVKLGPHQFLDFFPEPVKGVNASDEDPYTLDYIALHAAMRLQVGNDRVRLLVLDGDWVERQLKQGKVRLSMVEGSEENVPFTTSPTRDLQRLYRRAAGDPKAWAGSVVLARGALPAGAAPKTEP